MKRLLMAILVIVLTVSSAFADRWYVLIALDTEGFKSGYSNEVSFVSYVQSVTFEWKPNSEPDIYGYQFHVRVFQDEAFTPIDIDIFHLDHCLETVCQWTLKLEPITEIQLKERSP